MVAVDRFFRSPFGLLLTACVIAITLYGLGTLGIVLVLVVLGLYLLVKSAVWSVTKPKD